MSLFRAAVGYAKPTRVYLLLDKTKPTKRLPQRRTYWAMYDKRSGRQVANYFPADKRLSLVGQSDKVDCSCYREAIDRTCAHLTATTTAT